MSRSLSDLKIQKYLFVGSLFSVVKKFNHINLYGQLVMPLIGVYNLIVSPRLPVVMLPLIIMCILNLIPLLYPETNIFGVLRLCQFFLIISFSSFVGRVFRKESFRILTNVMAVMIVLFFLGEYFFSSPMYVSTYFSELFPRYKFIIGEVNYSGAMFAGMFFLCLAFDLKKQSLFFLFLLLVTFSRGATLALIFFGLSSTCSYLVRNKYKYFHFVFIFILVLYPFIITTLNFYLPLRVSKALTNVSPRYYLHAVYSLEGLKKPLGQGYFQSRGNISKYLEFYRGDFPWISQNLDFVEQHSIQVQVLSDFGLIGYLLFSVFIFLVGLFVLRLGNRFACSFSALLVLFTFINGLNEWIFWFSIGAFIHQYYGKFNQEYLRC